MNRMCVCFAGLGGKPAQMGFDAGDKKNKYADPRSRTAEILGLQDNKYIFKIRSQNVVNYFLPFCVSEYIARAGLYLLITCGPSVSAHSRI